MIARLRHTRSVLCTLGCMIFAATPSLGDVRTFTDPAGDAGFRRTDTCGCDPLLQDAPPPDLRSLTIQPWQSASAATDPYSGFPANHSNPSLARLDLVIAGVACPPGPLGLAGLDYDPQRFGKTPLYGFVEVDVDNDKDTGGEVPTTAATRLLANAARFGARPYGSIGERAACSADDLFQPWTNDPQVCRTGADWVVAFCGCFPVTVISTSEPGDLKFSQGDTWIVEGRFFQRTSAYRYASLMTGGSTTGAYDPIVRLRFQHSLTNNTTTITLVCALTQTGAGLLAGAPSEPIDLSAANQTSIVEGVTDLIAAANSRPMSGLTQAVTIEWMGRPTSDATNPDEWKLSALIGSTYSTPSDGLYAWTDIGFRSTTGDINGDDNIDALDRADFINELASLDGSSSDGDAQINGSYKITNFGYNFNRLDINYDGVVDATDLAFFPNVCLADFNQSGAVTPQDIFDFLNAWFAGLMIADINGSNAVTVQDIFDYLNIWFAGCP